MITPADFRTQLDQTIADAPRMLEGIPLIGYEDLDLKDASAAPLISILADMLLSQCTRPALAPANAQPAAA